MANRVVHFEIPTKDVNRASDFYSKAFGWEMQKQGEEYGGYVVAVTGPQGLPKDIKDMGISGGLYKEDDNENIKAYRCVIGVDDIKKAVADVKAAGGKVEEHNMTPDGKDMGETMDIPMVGIFAKCTDTEGNLFSLLQPSPDMMPKE